MKKLILSIAVGIVVLLGTFDITQAAGPCQSVDVNPKEPISPGQAVTVVVYGCTDPEESYRIEIQTLNGVEVYRDVLTEQSIAPGVYSVTILTSASWGGPGNYRAVLVDAATDTNLRGGATQIQVNDGPVTGPVGNLICDSQNVFDSATRTLRSCVGGARTVDELRELQVHVECLGNSNFPDGNICRGVYNSEFILGDYMDLVAPEVAQDDRGLWFTCFDAELPRAVGKVQVNYSHNNIFSCSSPETYTRPADWDPLGEGLPWHEPGFGENSVKCTNLNNGKSGINTALGCITIDDPNTLYIDILRWGLSLAGGVAFVIIIIGCFLIMISRGDPERLQSGKELLTAAISGLLLLIFSIFVLRIIGVKVLGIFQ